MMRQLGFLRINTAQSMPTVEASTSTACSASRLQCNLVTVCIEIVLVTAVVPLSGVCPT